MVSQLSTDRSSDLCGQCVCELGMLTASKFNSYQAEYVNSVTTKCGWNKTSLATAAAK